MPKSQSQKTTLKRRRSAVGILLSGLGRIAADLHSYGTLSDEPLKSLRMPDVLPTLPLHHVSDSIAPPACQESKRKAEDYEDRLPVAKRLRLSPSVQVISQAYIAEPPFLPTIQDVETAPSTSLPPCFMIDLLPNEILDLVGQWLDDKDLKVATMVCELFRDIFFPIYLRRNNFSPRQGFISLKGLSDFRVFRSYHRFPHRPWRSHLSAHFSRDADADTEILCLAYALAQFPASSFRSISLRFSRYNLIHAEPLTELLAALVPIQCSSLTITACLTGEHHIDIPMPPVYTTMGWNLTNLTIEGNLNFTPFRPLLFGASQRLEELTLRSLDATSTSSLWETLLNTTTFPKLRSFQTSEDMPLSLLLGFLSRHPKVSILAITNTYSKPTLMDDIVEKIDLKSLTIISGPPSYILTVLRSASTAPSLTRLSLLLNYLPNMSIFPEVLKCLAVCQKVEALEVTLPRPNCRVSTQTDNKLPLLDFTILAIKVFRITLLDPDFDEDGDASNEDIMATWDEWKNYFQTVEHLQFEESFSLGLRNSFFEESCKRFPSLAVSVCLDFKVMANQLALETGGFDWHTI